MRAITARGMLGRISAIEVDLERVLESAFIETDKAVGYDSWIASSTVRAKMMDFMAARK